MKKLFALFLVVSSSFCLFGQAKIPTKEINAAVEEGKLLYRCELAVRNGLNIAIKNGVASSDIKGFFSRVSNDTTYWICYSKDESPEVLATITFDSTSTRLIDKVDLTLRKFTPVERDLYLMNEQAMGLARIQPSIRSYEKTTMRAIPIKYKGKRKVYIMTQSTQPNEVIFGNDHVFVLNEDYGVESFKHLHNNMIAIEYGKKKESPDQVEESLHSHNATTGDLITPTDVCILMLNAKTTKWKQHTILTPNLVYTWNCQTNQLSVTTRQAVEKALNAKKPAKK